MKFLEQNTETLVRVFTGNMLSTNRGFNYYVDWANVDGYREFMVEIHAMDVLIGCKDDAAFEARFMDLVSKLPGVTFNSPEGAFYIMATLPVDDAEKLQYFLLEEFDDQGETVMFTPAEGSYSNPADGRNKIRIAYVTNPADIARGVEILGRGIEAYNARKA